MVTLSELVQPLALVIVHWNTLLPTPKAVSPDVGEVGVVIVPLPETNVHRAVSPAAALFPANVVVRVVVPVAVYTHVVGEAAEVVTQAAVTPLSFSEV